jgi:hypothetical protein
MSIFVARGSNSKWPGIRRSEAFDSESVAFVFASFETAGGLEALGREHHRRITRVERHAKRVRVCAAHVRQTASVSSAVPHSQVAVERVERVSEPNPRRVAGTPRGVVVAFFLFGPDKDAEHGPACFFSGFDRRVERLVVVQTQVLAEPHHRAGPRRRFGFVERRGFIFGFSRLGGG